MLIIPAIDLKDGRCVRLTQGKPEEETVYSANLLEVAKRWEREGARLIHVVDLDGAFAGEPKNQETILRIVDGVNIPIQVGGGIRTMEVIEDYLTHGSQRVVLGTIAQETPSLLIDACKRFPGQIAVGIDARDGVVATRGWVQATGERAIDLARRLEGLGVACIIYTDIERDGMLAGPNIRAIEAMVHSITTPVIASGGVSSIKDIEALQCIGLEGVIIGKALYTGAIDLREAIDAYQTHHTLPGC